jgi:hypothetical protein
LKLINHLVLSIVKQAHFLTFPMRKIFTLIVLFLNSFLSLRAQEKSTITDSKIDRVIVFLQGAQVERIGQTSIPAGPSSIVFQGLSPEIEEQSIQVKGEGNFTILSVNRQSNFLNEQKENEEIKRLQDGIMDLKDKLDIQNNQVAILKKEEEMLAQNQSIGNEGAGLDLDKLRLALDFQKGRLTENKVKQHNIQKEIMAMSEQVNRLSVQINDLKGKSKKSTSDVVVKISAKAAGTARFRVSYLVKNASWYPTYDLRATDVNKPISLIYRANISQQSGEEWKSVNLVLSSGDPSRNGNRPELKVYQIGYNIANHRPGANFSSVYGRIKDATDAGNLAGVSVRVKGTPIGTVSDASGYYSIQIPSPNAVLEYSYIGYERVERPVITAEINVDLKADQSPLSEVVVTGYGQSKSKGASLAGKAQGINLRGMTSTPASEELEVQVQQNQTTVQFEVKQPYSISSDGKQLAVEIGQHELPAVYRYYAVPKLSGEAYLNASISGISDLNLLSGEATIFFEGAFLGKTLINVDNTNDSLEVSLGPDKGVSTKRSKQKDENSGSFIGSTQRATRAYLIEVYNHKSETVIITLEDQLPVSNSSDVTIEGQELSGAKLDVPTGKLTWDLQLLPGEKKSLLLKYQVKYPKNRPVVLE